MIKDHGDKYPLTWEQAVAWLRAQPEHELLVRACYFDDPLLDAACRYESGPEWRTVRSFLPVVPGAALDVGAGRGISSYALAVAGWRVTALEPDPSPLVGAEAIRRLASESGVDINVVEGTGERLPFEDASFDLIHARQALHHAHDLGSLCREAARVLKSNGILIATREHVVDTLEDRELFKRKHPLHRFYGGENAFSLFEYRDALRCGGLKIVREFSPWETLINYFPANYDDVREQAAQRLCWPWPRLLPRWMIYFVSRRLHDPGRLFTFICQKR